MHTHSAHGKDSFWIEQDSEDLHLILTLLFSYHSKHMIRRSFHVSPFNNRSGVYEAHVSDPSTGKLDIILNIKRYLDGSPEATTESSPPIWLTARVWGHSYELSVRTMLYLLLTYPLTAFMTVPRILAEAWKLAYRHGLGVYQRPAQYRTPLDGSTAVWKKESAFQRSFLFLIYYVRI